MILLLLLVLLFPFGVTFSRYVGDWFYQHYLEAQQFYFNSDKLTTKTPLYRINNWSGIGEFKLQIDINSIANNLLKSEMDIDYTIEYYCQSDVICNASKDKGIIYAASNKDNFELTITPQREFKDGESTTIEVYATSISPYKKRIGATFMISVGKQGISYEIIDSKNSPYLKLNITNSISSYKVKTAFGSYQVGDELDEAIYVTLPKEDQEKCYSAIITIAFDPNVILLDTTESIIQEAIVKTTAIDSVDYINEMIFDVDALSSTEIRFYKVNVEEDYSFPLGTTDSVITVS